jgi:hypothetical protein
VLYAPQPNPNQKACRIKDNSSVHLFNKKIGSLAATFRVEALLALKKIENHIQVNC